jgi:hypothetical protein
MTVAASKAAKVEPESDLLQLWFQSWVTDCNRFRRWEREELILKQPSSEIVAEHAKKSQFFLLSGRLLQGLMTSPGCSCRELRGEVDGKVRQLEETWEMIHQPMSDQEAEVVLQKAFPDGPRTGTVA